MANTYVALSTVTVGAGGAADITFSNIPQTYDDLIVVVSGRSTYATSTFNEYAVWLSGDSFPSYGSRYTKLATNGTTVSGSFNWTYLQLGDVPNANADSRVFGNSSFLITDYVNENTWKSINALSFAGNNTTTQSVTGNAALRGVTGAVTQIVLWNSLNWAQYSTATLYGVFHADVSSVPGTPTIGTATAQPQQASITFTAADSNAASYTMTSTPGNITATGSASPIIVKGLTAGTSYTFKVKANNPFGSSSESAASNSVTPTVAIDYLVVAGGAGGSTGYSGAYGGASGAGGVRSSFGTTGGFGQPQTPITLTTSTNYTVVVGTGGSRAGGDNAQGTDGNNSTFSTITSTGGGAGAGTNNGGTSALYARSGGSGGGGAFGTSPLDIGGAGTVGQGFAGNNYIGGGQAGSGGSSGAYPLGNIDGQASAGVGNNITGSIVQYARGGFSVGSTTATGYGNGGNGGRYSYGSGQEPSNGNAGVVILRYPSAYTISLSGVSGSTATVGSFKVTTITSGSGTVSWT
jgi:hypothetical protein